MKEIKNGCIIKGTVESVKGINSSEILCENLEMAKELFDMLVSSNLKEIDLLDLNKFEMELKTGIFKYYDKRLNMKYTYEIIENVDYSY